MRVRVRRLALEVLERFDKSCVIIDRMAGWLAWFMLGWLYDLMSVRALHRNGAVMA